MEELRLHIAPMQGFTDNAWRRAFGEVYGAPDVAYTPFMRVEKGAPRRRDVERLKEAESEVVPQIIFGTVEEFRMLTEAVKELGYRCIDLNLGCPYPMQTRRGRGAAMIANRDVMAEVVSLIVADTECNYSVKMRLGLESPEEWRVLLPLLNDASLSHVTVHPRTAKDDAMHKGEFAALLAESANLVVWNGDISSPQGIDAIRAKYPSIAGVMTGRGLLARPSLFAEWREGSVWSREVRLGKILSFHTLLFNTYQATLCGATQILQKIKPFWEYLEPEIGHRTHKALRKATTIDKYRQVVAQIDY